MALLDFQRLQIVPFGGARIFLLRRERAELIVDVGGLELVSELFQQLQ